MAMSIEKFRKERAAKQGRGRYTKAARQWGIRFAQAQLERGRKLGPIAAELGVSDMTLRSWLYSAMAAVRTPDHGELCEVVITEPVESPAKGPRSLTVTTAEGHVVTGLDLDGAVSLLRALR